jgi:flagellar biosynthesis/type III secretory pathway protein FliH
VHFQFVTIKLLEFDRQMLDNTHTLMAAFIQAHLDTLETRGDPPARLARRIERYRRILRQGYSAEAIRPLINFFDWLMRLPPALAEQAHAALHAAEEEFQMTYITTHEQIGIAKGRSEGLIEGLALALEIKFGVAAQELIARLETIHDITILESVKERIRTATTIDDLHEVLKPPTAR